MAAGRSPAVSVRRRSRPTPSSPSPARELPPLPPGTEIEARVDDEGFYGSWFEATVVDFEPARGPRYPAQYTVDYSHLVSEDGTAPVAASHVRPRPPPPPPHSAPGSSSPPAPEFLLHDIVEAFDGAGWWSGIVVAPVPDPGSTVTVAFPITREVMPFPAHLVRRRRDYVGGQWVPSLSVVAVQPKRGARIYKAGEKVEVLREREAYGESWFPATVAKAVDRLSYIVEYEYLDEQEGGGKATEYLHFGYIRPGPAEYPRLRESKVRFGPGTAVEVLCDGAWSPGVVRAVVREGCEYEVSVHGLEVEMLLTMAAEQLRPLCIWNGKHWTIATDDKGQHNSRQQYASRKHQILPADATPSDDQGLQNASVSPILPADAIPSDDQGLQHASVSPILPSDATPSDDQGLQRASVAETDTTLSGSFKSLASNHCLNSCSLLSEKNGLSVFPHGTLNTCSMSKNRLFYSSSGHSSPPDELMPNAIGETEFSQDVEMVPSDGQHKTLVCGKNTDETCDILSTPEVRKQNIASSLMNQETQERTFFARKLSVKKCITKNKRGETHSKAHQGKNDASERVQVQLKENRNFSSEQFLFALSASPECQTTSAQTLEVTGGTSSDSDAEGVNFDQLARKEGTGLLDKEIAATINRICEGNRNQDACADTADTQVTKSNRLTDATLQSHDRLVPQDGNQVDEGSILQNLQIAGSSVPSDMAFSQTCGHKVPFDKRSPLWHVIDMMDVFKEVPQQPHFRPLMQSPADLREGMALGLMSTFASLVEDIRKSSIADCIALLQEKSAVLCYLEENGFSVQFLQCGVTKLLQIKSEHSNYVAEKEHLKARLLEKKTSLSQTDERLEKKKQIIADLEEELGRARLEAQKIMEEKEGEDKELSRLEAADHSVEEACGVAELQFQSVLAELRCLRLT